MKRFALYSLTIMLLLTVWADAQMQTHNKVPPVISHNIDMGNKIITNIGNAGTDFDTGGNLTVASAAAFKILSRLRISAPSDGVVLLQDSSESTLARVQLGGTAATNAALAPASVTGGWGLNLPSAANTNGQTVGIHQVTELTTIAAAATTDTTIQIPANVIVLSVSVRVTVVIPTAATFTVIGTSSSTAFQTGASVSTAANTTDVGNKSCPYLNTSAQTIRITPNAQPADNSGRVRVTIHYINTTAPTS